MVGRFCSFFVDGFPLSEVLFSSPPVPRDSFFLLVRTTAAEYVFVFVWSLFDVSIAFALSRPFLFRSGPLLEAAISPFSCFLFFCGDLPLLSCLSQAPSLVALKFATGRLPEHTQPSSDSAFFFFFWVFG